MSDLEEPIIADEDVQVAPRVQGRLEGNCIQCKVAMGAFLGQIIPEGPIHNECIPAFKRSLIERCAHCDNVLETKRTLINGKKLHPECLADHKNGRPYVQPTKDGQLSKFAVGRSFFGAKNWKDRWFTLNKLTGLCYYESQDACRQGKAPKGTVPMSRDTRLVTRPTRQLHKEAMDQSKELIVVFQEGGKERMLLMAAKSYQERDAWVDVLKTYLKNVDDPRDHRD